MDDPCEVDRFSERERGNPSISKAIPTNHPLVAKTGNASPALTEKRETAASTQNKTSRDTALHNAGLLRVTEEPGTLEDAGDDRV